MPGEEFRRSTDIASTLSRSSVRKTYGTDDAVGKELRNAGNSSKRFSLHNQPDRCRSTAASVLAGGENTRGQPVSIIGIAKRLWAQGILDEKRGVSVVPPLNCGKYRYAGGKKGSRCAMEGGGCCLIVQRPRQQPPQRKRGFYDRGGPARDGVSLWEASR